MDVVNWYDKDYSVVTIRCKDRLKLLLGTVCTLTDMDYVVFLANINTEWPESYQVMPLVLQFASLAYLYLILKCHYVLAFRYLPFHIHVLCNCSAVIDDQCNLV